MQLEHRHRWMLTGSLVALLAGIVARVVLQRQWRQVTEREPPRDPSAADTPWLDAIVWTALTGLVGGVASLVARRCAAGVWRLATGDDPRDL